mmetsp:Transcript_8222/g.30326  ORF Transcript_8222/g.30326 Transcript_8222/m.30326 type:complete len:273 (-) Transcript_8222:565-1383(-)
MFAAVATIEVAVGNIEVGIAHAVTLVWKKGGWAFNGRTRVRFAGYTRIAGLPTLVEHVLWVGDAFSHACPRHALFVFVRTQRLFLGSADSLGQCIQYILDSIAAHAGCEIDDAAVCFQVLQSTGVDKALPSIPVDKLVYISLLLLGLGHPLQVTWLRIIGMPLQLHRIPKLTHQPCEHIHNLQLLYCFCAVNADSEVVLLMGLLICVARWPLPLVRVPSAVNINRRQLVRYTFLFSALDDLVHQQALLVAIRRLTRGATHSGFWSPLRLRLD